MGVEPILHRLGLVNGIEPLSSLKGPLPDVLPLNYTSRNSLYSESICMKAVALSIKLRNQTLERINRIELPS